MGDAHRPVDSSTQARRPERGLQLPALPDAAHDRRTAPHRPPTRPGSTRQTHVMTARARRDRVPLSAWDVFSVEIATSSTWRIP